jgi:putative ABC transport system ATP-binding protein
MNEQTAVVEINNLYLKSDQGEDVFCGLNLRLLSGQSACISGPAGSGKSSLVEIILGLRDIESGSVEVFGRQVTPRSGRSILWVRRKTGGVGGLFGLVPGLSVEQNILLPLVIEGVPNELQKDKLDAVLNEFNLTRVSSQFPSTLTRVENTLVQFARASIANQPLLIIDEPSAGLDNRTYERVFEFLVKASVEGRSMMILSTEPQTRQLPFTTYLRIDGKRLL